jgi:hypothetical protein
MAKVSRGDFVRWVYPEANKVRAPDALCDEGLVGLGAQVVCNEGEGGVFVALGFRERHHVEDLGSVSGEESLYGLLNPVGNYGGPVTVMGDFVGDVDDDAVVAYAEGFNDLFLLAVD